MECIMIYKNYRKLRYRSQQRLKQPVRNKLRTNINRKQKTIGVKKWYYLRHNSGKGSIVFNTYKNLPVGFDYANGKNSFIQGRSAGYETKEQLIKKCEILFEPCLLCKSPVKTNYNEYGPKLKESNLCFTCYHWEQIYLELKEYENSCLGINPQISSDKSQKTYSSYIIVNGMCNKDGGHQENKTGMMGHGGRLFKIAFLIDGTKNFQTNNLWCQGDIPKWFRSKLPDNAKFV